MNDSADTKTRLLDVAEELFAERGLDAVSVRDITEAASANLGAINYHFGSKEALIEEVFQRRVAPVNEARLKALDQVESKAAGRPLAVEDILEAFIAPAVNACEQCGNGTAFSKLFGRCLAEPKPEVERLLSKQFAPLAARFEGAILKALPNLTRAEVFWRLRFTFGALHHYLLTRDKFIPTWMEKVQRESQMRKLVNFAAAGFRA